MSAAIALCIYSFIYLVCISIKQKWDRINSKTKRKKHTQKPQSIRAILRKTRHTTDRYYWRVVKRSLAADTLEMMNSTSNGSEKREHSLLIKSHNIRQTGQTKAIFLNHSKWMMIKTLIDRRALILLRNSRNKKRKPPVKRASTPLGHCVLNNISSPTVFSFLWWNLRAALFRREEGFFCCNFWLICRSSFVQLEIIIFSKQQAMILDSLFALFVFFRFSFVRLPFIDDEPEQTMGAEEYLSRSSFVSIIFNPQIRSDTVFFAY